MKLEKIKNWKTELKRELKGISMYNKKAFENYVASVISAPFTSQRFYKIGELIQFSGSRNLKYVKYSLTIKSSLHYSIQVKINLSKYLKINRVYVNIDIDSENLEKEIKELENNIKEEEHKDDSFEKRYNIEMWNIRLKQITEINK